MKLRLESYAVTALRFSSQTTLLDRTLTINAEEIRGLAHDRTSMADVQVELVSPGEDARIIHVLDALEPRIKVGGDTVVFPGFLGPARTVGDGVTRRLSGLAVLESAQLPEPTGGILEVNEGLIDMSGPGAPLCACSTTHNVVLLFTPRPGVTNQAFEAAIRLGALRVSRRLAETMLAAGAPDEVEMFELGGADPALPRVSYVDQVQQQGFLVQTFLY